MSRKFFLPDFKFVCESYGRFKEGPLNQSLMRALLLRNMHMGRAKLPESPELGSCKAQGLPDEEGGLRCFCNKRLANYLLGLARWKNKHNVAARADRLMWGDRSVGGYCGI